MEDSCWVQTVTQLVRFGLVGCVNTFIDFLIYNLLAGPPIGFSRVRANLVSTGVAMLASFVMQEQLVFAGSGPAALVGGRLTAFLVVTVTSLYGVQTLVLWGWTRWRNTVGKQAGPACPARSAVALGIKGGDLLGRNAAKLAATVVSLSWNYCWYKFWVFSG